MKKGVSRKSQVTIFVIIAILIVGILGAYFLVKNVSNNALTKSPEYKETYSSLDKCLEKSTLDALYDTGLQGGYSLTPEPKIDYLIFGIPIYFQEGSKLLPPKDIFEKQLALAIKENILYCSIDTTSLAEKEYKVNLGEVKTLSVKFLETGISLDLNWPISITREKESFTFPKVKKTVSFDFNSKYKNMEDFLVEQQAYPTQVLLTQMAEFSAERGFSIEGQIINETKSTMYSFVYDNVTYNNRTYINSFAVRY
jgi:hypothetical protein